MEAAVILAKCLKRGQLYGMRTQKMEDGDWWRTWAFPVDERKAHKEGYDGTKVLGNLYHTDEYPGCPYCGTYNFLQCGNCQKISCWNKEEKVTCPWCNTVLDNIVTAEDEFSVSGGDI